MHARLDGILDQLERFKSGGIAEDISRMIAMSEVAEFAGVIVSSYWRRSAAFENDAPTRADFLRKLATQLTIADGLFMEGECKKEVSFVGLAEELTAIANGDEPRLTSQLVDTKKLPARADRFRLRALEWERYLKAIGIPTHERKNKVAAAFGSSWEAIRKWESLITPRVGELGVQLALATAERAGSEAREHRPCSYVDWLSVTDWQVSLAQDGRQLQQELRARG